MNGSAWMQLVAFLVALFALAWPLGHYLAAVLRGADDGRDKPARQLFGFSILYLFVLFTLLIVDRAPGILGDSALVAGLAGLAG